MDRKSLDVGSAFAPRRKISCGDYPSELGCTVTITGTEEEVVRLAALHAVDAHGHQDTPELREKIRASLRDEVL
jgi:predicted small metal-binding protein